MTDKPVKALKVKPPKLTAAERRAKEAEERVVAKAAFEKKKPAIWLKLWTEALRLALVMAQDNRDFVASYENSYPLEGFVVAPLKLSFTVSYNPTFTEANLTEESAKRAEEVLQEILDGYNRHIDMIEEQARAEALRLQLRSQALAKLTPEEKKALGH